MFNLSPLASLFALVAFAGFGVCVFHLMARQWGLMRTRGLSPFSLRDAADVMGGAHVTPGEKSLFERRYGKLALALMCIGFFGALATVIVEIVMTPRP